MNKLLYVAGPYAGDTKGNITRAEEVSISLIRNGFHVFTPHKNMAGYEKYEGNGIGYETWLSMDLDILSRCNGIYVMANSGKSPGVRREVDFALENNIPIFHELEYPHISFSLEMFASIIEGS
ncbi:DUF4406 domain-containing protein [Candidatus Dependentiae bacterium]|nr:DUF4406 domain-containing protein [Candidatus Dependentiae bacterium]